MIKIILHIFQVFIVPWVLPTRSFVRGALTVTKLAWKPQLDPVLQDTTAQEDLKTPMPPFALQGTTAHLEHLFRLPALLEQYKVRCEQLHLQRVLQLKFKQNVK